MKLAPKGEATAYLAVLSLVNALAAGAALIIGGLCADFFAERTGCSHSRRGDNPSAVRDRRPTVC